MDSLVSMIVLIIISACMELIAFLLGVLCVIPENDPESEIDYLKKRINILEEREHMRILEEHEVAMMVTKDPVVQTDAFKEKEKKSTEKKGIQTVWREGDER